MYAKKILILGIGNILWADEGFGVRTVERLNQLYEFPENVRLLDGGTQGLYLIQDVREAKVLIVFDAIDYGLPPGTLKVLEDKKVPKFMGVKKVSLHQTGFQEVLALAELMGDYPEKLLLIGVQPEEIEDYGGSLYPAVKEQIQPAIEKALEYLNHMGISCRKRKTPLTVNESCSLSVLNMRDYESGRPSEKDALRNGDERVLKSDDFMVTEPCAVSMGENALDVGFDHHLEKYR